MAYMATIQLLIEAETESSATSIAKELASQMQAAGQILDSQVGDVSPVNQFINEQIADGTYVLGECFGNYIVVSIEKRDPDTSFWSNTFGWTSYDLATRFDALVDRLPSGLTNKDSMFLLDRGAEQINQFLAQR
jgi:hypothetical protein